MQKTWNRLFIILCIVSIRVDLFAEETRFQSFDQDPSWIGHNNRTGVTVSRQIIQDFGYSRTNHGGVRIGEMGGTICPAAEPSYYAKPIPQRTLDNSLSASGSLFCTGRPFHVLLGFFHADSLNEWRTPNTIALRLSGRGDVFYAWLEYCTSRWRAGGDSPQSFATIPDPNTGRSQLKGLLVNTRLNWSMRYDPQANGGSGSITATIGDQSAVCHIDSTHRSDGAVFSRFGLMTVMKSADTEGELWLDDIAINGEVENFDLDPHWEGVRNCTKYSSTNVRPYFDFGFSPTNYAGGTGMGEMGGLIFRGDCRYPKTMAYYADKTSELTLARPLRASGRVVLRRGVTDSTVLFGFFHSRDSVQVNPAQDSGLPRSFLGISTDGPSRDGFYFAPTYRTANDAHGQVSARDRPPQIYPDGKSHSWSLEYLPSTTGGQITVALDDRSVQLNVPKEHVATATRFDRFGIVTTWIDGNGQNVYWDDLTYTVAQ